MKKVFIFIAIVFLTGAGAKAQLYKQAETFLWKITGNNLKQESYFIITMNNTCEEKVVLSPAVLNALHNVQQMVFETGLTNRENEKKVQKLVVLNDENKSAKNTLSPNTYSKLKQKAEAMGINELFLNEYNMFFISIKLFTQCIDCPLQQVDRLEDELRLYAQKNKMQISDLFSAEESLSLFFDSQPNEYWDSYISYLLSYPQQETININTKAALYKQQKFIELKKTFTNNNKIKTRYLFLENENKRMNILLHKIEDKIKDNSSLIALDISEVANEPTSIFNQLIKAGYTISPVLN